MRHALENKLMQSDDEVIAYLFELIGSSLQKVKEGRDFTQADQGAIKQAEEYFLGNEKGEILNTSLAGDFMARIAFAVLRGKTEDLRRDALLQKRFQECVVLFINK